jgi:hypothetical protein
MEEQRDFHAIAVMDGYFYFIPHELLRIMPDPVKSISSDPG